MPAGIHHFAEGIVDQRRQPGGAIGCLQQRAGTGERDELTVDPLLRQHCLPVRDIAMPAHRDVRVARGVEYRIALGIIGDLERARAGAQGVDEGRGIVVVVDIDHRHGDAFRERPLRARRK